MALALEVETNLSIELFSKSPSLQHAVRLIDDTPEKTAKNILEMRDGGRRISTHRAKEYFAHVLSKKDIRWLRAQIPTIKNKHLRKAVAEILPLAEEFLQTFGVAWFRPIPKQASVFLGNVQIPVSPLGFIGIEDGISLVWPQTWKKTYLSAQQYNLLITILLKRFLPRYPEVNQIHWVELSAPPGHAERKLQVRTSEAARILSDQELQDIGENLEIALKIVENTPKAPKPSKSDPKQGKFDFDDDED